MIADTLRRIQTKNVYAGANDGKVRKLDPSDGSTLWTSADFGSYAYGMTTNYYAGWGI